MTSNHKLSVVVPVYMGCVFLRELYERIKKSVESVFTDFELILVNDASPDNAWPEIEALCKADTRVKGINLSRNFGQHYAITAGLTYVTGEWVVVMDCDLQDVPEEIPKLYKKACEGFSVVFAQRIDREDSWFKRTQSKVFHGVFDYLTDRKSDPSVANFGIYHRKVIKAVLEFGDCVKCFPLIVTYVGFATAYIPVTHDPRKSGKSSYTLGKALRFATNLMLAYSNKPLRLFTAGGFVVVAGSFAISLYYLILHLSGKIAVSGYTSLILSIWFVGGMLMMQIGIVGVYLGRVFNQTKNRPSFVIDEHINTTEHEA
jgi:glycosyltransferase involved in cell wall biosynthesis